MKRAMIVPVCIIAMALAIAGDGDAAAPWKIAKTGEGIRAYSRTAEGSPIFEFMAVSVINTRLENIGQVLRDVEAYPQWMAKCRESRLVTKITDNDMIVYIQLDFPAPVANRDLVVKGETVYDLSKARGVVSLGMVKDSPEPERKGVKRMAEFSGTYVFEFITREKTGVRYLYRANPGGTIPAFIINMFSKQLLYDTLKGLRTMTAKEKYITGAAQSKDRVLFEGIFKDREKVRGIVLSRLNEYCRDRDFIQRLVKSDAVVNLLAYGDGAVLESIFMSGGSRGAILEAAKTIMRTYLAKHTADAALVERVLADQALLDTVIDGPKPGTKTGWELLNAHIAVK